MFPFLLSEGIEVSLGGGKERKRKNEETVTGIMAIDV